ncbi:hypothetical protein [Hufsiella ginkgonis]|uniref:Uncharacterized protein n=1 Tax=Hufsiella ginkgonis TaxID=2695274 RepID=A0A7K1XS69_9SPHI|nr:hypothetical protein [Hufsiella ginkgonis]MXV13784.1 hypothetical protein [Hufsiella ginkgonis]
MKKAIYALILPLVVVSGLVFANRESTNETSPKSPRKPFSIADRKAGLEARKKWEASPDGIKFKEWEASPVGKSVHASMDKIREYVKDSTNMEAVITSLSLPPGSLLGGVGVMVRINGEAYILTCSPDRSGRNVTQFNRDLQQLHDLKVNDKIVVRVHSVGYAPKYSYPILSAGYVEQNGKVVFKRTIRKGGC